MNYKYKNEGIGRYVFLGVAGLLCFLLASSVLPFLSDAKAGAPVPDIMLCFVCALPAFTDMKKAGIYALSLGFLADLFITPPSSFSPVVFMGCMCIAAFCQRYFSRVGTLAIAISTIPCSAIRIIVSCVVTALTSGAEAAKHQFVTNIPQGIIVDFALAIVLAFIMRVLFKKMKFKTNN